jgi:hypothetical protein
VRCHEWIHFSGRAQCGCWGDFCEGTGEELSKTTRSNRAQSIVLLCDKTITPHEVREMFVSPGSPFCPCLMQKSSSTPNRFRSAVEQCERAGLTINSNPSPDGRTRTLLKWRSREVLLLDDEFIHGKFIRSTDESDNHCGGNETCKGQSLIHKSSRPSTECESHVIQSNQMPPSRSGTISNLLQM